MVKTYSHLVRGSCSMDLLALFLFYTDSSSVGCVLHPGNSAAFLQQYRDRVNSYPIKSYR